MDFANYWFSSAAGGGGGYQIGNSLRYSTTSARLENNNRPAGDGQKGTWSLWAKRGELDQSIRFFWTGVSATTTNMIAFIIVGDELQTNDGGAAKYNSASLYRDYSAWYHIVVVLDTTLAAAEDRVKYYVNGVRAPISSTNSIALNKNTHAGSATQKWNIGTGYSSTGTRFATQDRYMAEYHYCGGLTLEPTDFGEFNADGVWVPIEYAGAHGVNGFYLDFSDPNDIGADRSGNGNNFTPTGFELTNTSSTSYDWMEDSPTNNYATGLPLLGFYGTGSTSNKYSQANLAWSLDGSERRQLWTHGLPPGGKYYAEMTFGGNNANMNWVVCNGPNWLYNNSNTPEDYISLKKDGNNVWSTIDGWATAPIVTGVAGQGGAPVVGVTVDTTAWPQFTVQFYGATGSPLGAAYTKTFTRGQALMLGQGGANSGTSYLNSGTRPFAHTIPTGFEPLSTAELPAVDITNPSDHFQTLLGPGPGTGSTTPIGVQYKTSTVPDSPASTYDDQVYGKPTTDLGATDGVHPMLEWASRLSLSGYDDWYIPAMHELEIVYRNLKPTTDSNYTGSGYNPNAVPPTSEYTESDPAQTTATLFQSGNTQAFAPNLQYWTTSQLTNSNPSQAWYHEFLSGIQNANPKTNANYARAVRRVPFTGSEPAIGAAYEGGYFGGLIDAKATPDGTATHALIVAPKEGGEYGVATGILDVAQRTFPNGCGGSRTAKTAMITR